MTVVLCSLSGLVLVLIVALVLTHLEVRRWRDITSNWETAARNYELSSNQWEKAATRWERSFNRAKGSL